MIQTIYDIVKAHGGGIKVERLKDYTDLTMNELKYKDITQKIIGACFEVHKFLGNGFQEVIYIRAITHSKCLEKLYGIPSKINMCFFNCPAVKSKYFKSWILAVQCASGN